MARGTGEAAIDQLNWLAGSWRAASDDGRSSSEEMWLSPAGGAMLGLNRAIHHGRMVFFEFVRIEERDGRLVYLAQPEGRAPATPFTSIEIGEQSITFENTAHDFPQRVHYRRAGDTLHARVSGVSPGDGRERIEEWEWRRVEE